MADPSPNKKLTAICRESNWIKASGAANQETQAHDVPRDSNFERGSIPSKRAESHIMLSHCANPRCHRPFLRLREGKLFSLPTDGLPQLGEPPSPPFVRPQQARRQVEHYWLCDQCA